MLKLELLRVQCERLMLTEDYPNLLKNTQVLASLNPPAGTSAATTLETARMRLNDNTPTQCTNSGCTHCCQRKHLEKHMSSCVFSLPLLTQSSVQVVSHEDCSRGFQLTATVSENEEFAGEFNPGPSEHIDDDEEGWFHHVDFPKQRILRIKYISRRWVLSSWKGPNEEKEILKGSESQLVDGANFDGFTMQPKHSLSWAANPSMGTLAKESIKLIYFGGMWCPYCPPFTKKLRVFFDVVRKVFGDKSVEVIFVSSDRDEGSMLEYYGKHHGDWFALPYQERKTKQILNEKFGVSGIPSIHVLGPDGEEVEYFKQGGERDIGSSIRSLPDIINSDATGVALQIFKLMVEIGSFEKELEFGPVEVSDTGLTESSHQVVAKDETKLTGHHDFLTQNDSHGKYDSRLIISDDNHDAAMLKLELLRVRCECLMLTEDYPNLLKNTQVLASLNPPAGSSAATTLETAHMWLNDNTPTQCTNSGCTHCCQRKHLEKHMSSCVFSLPLLTQSSVQVVSHEDCSRGFQLTATVSENEEFAGEFNPGPSEHIDDDEEGWFHHVDFPKQRILRIKYISRRWVLSSWKGPNEEKEILKGSESQLVDGANFDGFTMQPKHSLSWAANPSMGTLAKESIKLIYFGGMWCPYCPPFTKKLRVFFDVVRKVFGDKSVEVIFVSSDRDEGSMLEYYGKHHGDWFALPYQERKTKQILNEKFGVSGIPSIHVLGPDGEEVEYFKQGGERDIGSSIRSLPDITQLDSKGAAASVDLFKVIKQVLNTTELKKEKTRNAAYGLQEYLKVGDDFVYFNRGVAVLPVFLERFGLSGLAVSYFLFLLTNDVRVSKVIAMD